MSNRRKFESQLFRTIEQSATKVGFVRSKKEFYARFPDTFAIAGLQADKYNDDTVGRYIVNYSGGSRRYFEARGMAGDFKPGFGLFPFQARTGAFSGVDRWLAVSYEEPDELQILEYVGYVQGELKNLAEIFSSDNSICSWLKSDFRFGITDFARERAVALLGCG